MKNKAMQARLSNEVLDFIHSRKSLQLASLGADGAPYASYAPFAIGENCLYVMLSELAIHGINVQRNPRVSVLVIEDEDSADELFARVRVNYAMEARLLARDSDQWRVALAQLTARHGQRPADLSNLRDFKMFRLAPLGGRYVKGFGRAYSLEAGTLTAEAPSN